MEPLAIGGVLVSSLLVGIQPNLNRFLMKTRGFAELELLITRCSLMSACAFLVMLAPLCRHQFNGGFATTSAFLVPLAGTTAANVVGFYLAIRALREAEVSFIGPIAGMTPGIVAIGGLLFGELPGTLGWFGIALIASASYVHAREGAPLREYFAPFYLWRAFGTLSGLPEEEQRKRRGLRYAYASALCGTIGLTFDGLLARSGGPVLGIALEFGSLAAVYTSWQLIRRRKEGKLAVPFVTRARTQYAWVYLLALGTISGLSPLALIVSYTGAPIAYIGALKRLNLFFAMVFAFALFGELRKPGERARRYRRLLLGSTIVIGAILITLDPAKAHMAGAFRTFLTR